MKVLLTGGNGQLGTEISHQLENGSCSLGDIPVSLQGATIISTDLPEFDLTDKQAAFDLLAEHRPNIVINCAAFTNVDACEEKQDVAFAANAVAARNIAMACKAVGAKLIHVSTDYVFDGFASTPLNESALPNPQSVYGSTKRLGEEYVTQFCPQSFIVRTSWLYGQYGNNFVKTMVRITRENGSAKVVNDQFGNPTNAEDLAYHLLKLAASDEYGLYHCTGEGICSWYDFASEIIRIWGIDATVSPCTTEEFPRPAKRPAYSALDNAMLRATVGNEMRTWQDALENFYMQTDKTI